MVEPEQLIPELSRNSGVFENLLRNVQGAMVTWRKENGAWCLLEIVCHLLDEELEDFRARLRQTLENPGQDLASIDPVGWVAHRGYMQRDYKKVLDQFLQERRDSVTWLLSLRDTSWQNCSLHPEYGEISARKFLCNWLAHDYHHIRQINQIQYHYLKAKTGEDLTYAGNW